MKKTDKIYVAGHRGLVGSAILRCLRDKGFANIITRSHSELDLTDQVATRDFFKREAPEYVFLAAAKVGGILANNTCPADFIYQNLIIQNNVIHQSYLNKTKRLLFLGSSCIYPRECPQPMKEEYLLSGYLEPTNRPYAVAKIAGIEMCWSYNRQYCTRYLAAMPTNLYGPADNYDLQNSHVLPAVIRKFHLAKLAEQRDLTKIQQNEAHKGIIPDDVKKAIGVAEDLSSFTSAYPKVIMWGTGTPRRELLYSDDMADACVFLINLDDADFDSLVVLDSAPLINIGYGEDQTISELVEIVKHMVDFDGKVEWDRDKPDGMPEKLLDASRLSSLGWKAQTSMIDGIKKTYQDYLGIGV